MDEIASVLAEEVLGKISRDSESYVQELQERASNCVNIDDMRCNYVRTGSCFGCTDYNPENDFWGLF